jgi:predicted nuclease with TOPRIM domain
MDLVVTETEVSLEETKKICRSLEHQKKQLTAEKETLSGRVSNLQIEVSRLQDNIAAITAAHTLAAEEAYIARTTEFNALKTELSDSSAELSSDLMITTESLSRTEDLLEENVKQLKLLKNSNSQLEQEKVTMSLLLRASQQELSLATQELSSYKQKALWDEFDGGAEGGGGIEVKGTGSLAGAEAAGLGISTTIGTATATGTESETGAAMMNNDAERERIHSMQEELASLKADMDRLLNR